jgi:hypothetical protein
MSFPAPPHWCFTMLEGCKRAASSQIRTVTFQVRHCLPCSQPCGQPPRRGGCSVADQTDLGQQPNSTTSASSLLPPAKVDLDLDLDLDLHLNLDLDSAQPSLPGAKLKVPSFRKVNSASSQFNTVQYRPMQKRPEVCPSLATRNNTSARVGSTTLQTATTANQPADPVPAVRPCPALRLSPLKTDWLGFCEILQVGGVGKGMGMGTLQPPHLAQASRASLASPVSS